MRMRSVLIALAVLIYLCLLSGQRAEAYLVYSPGFCEFRITYPEAPVVNTLWVDQDPPHFMKKLSDGESYIGEEAFYQRRIPGEYEIMIRTTCIKADPKQTEKITKDYLMSLVDTYAHLYMPILENKKRSYTPWGEHIKWGLISGYSFSKSKKQIIHVAHILSGKNSIFIVEGRIMGGTATQIKEYEDVIKSINIDFE